MAFPPMCHLTEDPSSCPNSGRNSLTSLEPNCIGLWLTIPGKWSCREVPSKHEGIPPSLLSITIMDFRFPWVMLGLRTMPKDDLGTSPAELVFGSPLMVSGEFVGHGQDEPLPEQLHHLHDNVADFLSVPPVHHASPTASSPTSLFSAKFIVICCNSHKSPLQPRYDGLFSYCPQGTNSSRFRSAIMWR